MFQNCQLPPGDNTERIDANTFNVAPLDLSSAIGAGIAFPNLNDDHPAGSGPSLGSVEKGCLAKMIYGPRLPGQDDSVVYTCNGYK